MLERRFSNNQEPDFSLKMSARMPISGYGGDYCTDALDLNWDEPNERQLALGLVLAALESVECWLQPQTELKKTCGVESSLAIAHQVRTQDVQTSTAGIPQLRRGVAPSRRITVEDPIALPKYVRTFFQGRASIIDNVA